MVNAPTSSHDPSPADGVSTPPLTGPHHKSPLPHAHPFLEVALGALYDPRLLYDYGGPLFAHKLAKLKQCNIVAKDGSLVPPWSKYDHLRTGTVVLMHISLHTYDIPISSYKTRKVSKHDLSYFIRIHSHP